jgi:starch-binding outer membrane protein, SusD/RagB family
MKMKINIWLILLGVLVFTSCDDLLSPVNENFQDVNNMYTDTRFAQGILMNGYRYIPSYYDNTEYATDDAVTNQMSNSFLQMATGSWSSINNPVNRWNDDFVALQYLNEFLANVDSVKWSSTDTEVRKLFARRLRGEAYGLRALHNYYLLRNHAGFTADNQLMGVQILTKYQGTNSNFNIPRSTFEACMKQIYLDLDSADACLPMEYNDLNTTSGVVPAKYQSITKTVNTYNRIMGQYARTLFNGLIGKSFRARAALLAASPAFQDASNTGTWASAADFAAAVIDYNISVNGAGSYWGLASNGSTFYANTTEIDALASGTNPKEIIWRGDLQTTNSAQESANFPPSLGGTGYMNPTQNLVDAFPTATGYPIDYSDQTKSGYNASTPYANRDPRLSNYIIYNGSTNIGVSKVTIYTGSTDGAASGNGVNVRSGYSTRTGYYMKKRLRMDVNTTSGSVQGKTHYNPRIRYTEIYLSYAEAANEAWGPKGMGTHTYSAYDIIKAIRKRSNSNLSASDPYLDECATDQAQMRELIRNERRIELSFESFRFWDLRRWKVQGQNIPNLNETARGMDVNIVNGITVYSPLDVEIRNYKDYMYYGPIPYTEVIKYSNLLQNKGW